MAGGSYDRDMSRHDATAGDRQTSQQDRAADGPGELDRRGFLTSALALVGLGSYSLDLPSGVGGGQGAPDGSGGHGQAARRRRRKRAAQRRQESIQANLRDRPLTEQPTSGDETRFGRGVNYVASFSKGLPHDEYGEVDPDAFEALVAALDQPNGGDFEAIPQAGVRPLTNPEAAVSYNSVGLDPNDVYAPAAPAFDSAETAAEMVELYWMALLRDVPFHAYESDGRVAEAAAELSRLTDFAGPTDPAGVFRGTVPGVNRGPFVSQFLYRDFERGVHRRDQRLRVFDPDNGEYLTDYDEWLAVQNGETPNGGINHTTPGGPSAADAGIRTDRKRYMITGRDLATYVVANVSQQPYMNAALILQNSELFDRDPLDDGLPIAPNVPAGFTDYGRSAYQSLLGGIVQAHKHAAWYHKWRVHRRLRPEAFGGRVHHVLDGTRIDGQPAADRYPVHGQLLDSAALDRTRKTFDTALLPQAYPEGGPTHPSYPGGHAVSAGSCATVLKAYFDEGMRLPNPVRPTTDADGRYTELEPVDADLTVGGELNKLATNIAYARSWAGIHYRSDTTAGLRIGERVAASMLRDRLRQRPADAYGSRGSFTFTTFDGTEVTVTADGVTPESAFDPPLFRS